MTNGQNEGRNLILGIVMGALFGIIGNFMAGYYFWGLEHTDDQWKFWFVLIVTIIVVLFCMRQIKILSKKQ